MRMDVVLVRMCLLNLLQMYRYQKSLIERVPRYVVFNNQTLKLIAQSRPRTVSDLLKIKGIGDARSKKYGDDIVKIIRENPLPVPAPQKVVIQHARPRKKKTMKITSQPQTVQIQPTQINSMNTEINKPIKIPPMQETKVYILELENNKVYVGKSTDVKRRVSQHENHVGAVFTKRYQPTGKMLPRLGNVQGLGDAAERDETLRYMYVRGVDNVRGWKYTQIDLSPADKKEAEMNIREMFDLCRRCGRHGHFIKNCKFTTDRFNKKLT